MKAKHLIDLLQRFPEREVVVHDYSTGRTSRVVAISQLCSELEEPVVWLTEEAWRDDLHPTFFPPTPADRYPEVPMDVFRVLFDWWRGDAGVLPEGVEMPIQEQRQRALKVFSAMSVEETDCYQHEMVIRGWFQSNGLTLKDQDYFNRWLGELQNEEGR